ncbi:MAG: ATP:cob(I)alamin adenosyltransferase [Bacillaceae bacterium G1]|nr:MAG: ATP:cob(I)alamin adenosyltransferase [Bacillaceae bacterium G1]
MIIYTRRGDGGETAVFGGRVRKDHPRVEAYGSLDEVNCQVGEAIVRMVAKNENMYADLIQLLTEVQHELFDCIGDLATVKQLRPYKIHAEHVNRLEQWIDHYAAQTPAVSKFVLPGGTAVSAALHLCRTVTRRAERRVVALARQEAINPEVGRYVNRLSDLFFVLARVANAREGVPDVQYERGREVFRRRSRLESPGCSL